MRKTKINTRLTASLLIMCLVPITILALLFYNTYQDTMYDKLSASTRQGLVLFSTILDFHLGKCESISDGIMLDDIVQSALSSNDKNNVPTDPTVGASVAKAFNNLSVWESYMKGFTLCNIKGQPLASMGFINLEPQVLSGLLLRCQNEEEYKRWDYLLDAKRAPYIVLCRKIFSKTTLGRQLGYVLIFVDAKQMIDSFTISHDAAQSHVAKLIVEPRQERIVFFDGENRMDDINAMIPDYRTITTQDSAYVRAEMSGVDSMIVVQSQRKTGWQIIGVLPRTEIDSAVNALVTRLALIVGLLVVLCVAFSTAIQHTINKPIESIVTFTKDVAQGKFERRLNDASKDELGFLSQNIDSMVTRISELFEQVQLSESKKHVLELEILQYQINPHFLFNTLNSFQYVAELNGIKSISQGITSLSMLLRNTFDNTKKLLTLREELEIADAYLHIQSIKYAGMLSVSYEIDPLSWDVAVVRFILQPIIENSIIHGLSESVLHVSIQSEIQDMSLVLSVSDDGKGFDSHQKDISKKKFSGIGLRNVHERIQLQFGPDYGLNISSSPGAGTVTTVTLPCQAEKKQSGDG